MKLKVRPEDFRVEEKLGLKLKRAGAFSVYRLEKRLWNTLDVIRHLEQRHGMRRIGRAGLKDRYALSTQFLSIPGSGPQSIVEKNYSLRFVGRADQPVSRDALLGNRFTIAVRAMTADEVSAAINTLPRLKRFGFPNYYDEQRMGSARHGQGFIARRLIDGHFNGALKLYLATPSAADDAKTRRAKTLIEQNWGDWRRCLELVSPETWPLMKWLVYHPRDFVGAVKLIPRDLLDLFVNAYQAWLWNETMVGVLEESGIPVRFVDYALGRFAFYEELNPAQSRYLGKLVIPALAPDTVFSSDRVARVAHDVLKREGLELAQLKIKVRIHGVYFKGYERRAVAVPHGLQWSEPQPDDLYPGRQKLQLTFFLPAGSFATILVKSLLIQ